MAWQRKNKLSPYTFLLWEDALQSSETRAIDPVLFFPSKRRDKRGRMHTLFRLGLAVVQVINCLLFMRATTPPSFRVYCFVWFGINRNVEPIAVHSAFASLGVIALPGRTWMIALKDRRCFWQTTIETISTEKDHAHTTAVAFAVLVLVFISLVTASPWLNRDTIMSTSWRSASKWMDFFLIVLVLFSFFWTVYKERQWIVDKFSFKDILCVYMNTELKGTGQNRWFSTNWG